MMIKNYEEGTSDYEPVYRDTIASEDDSDCGLAEHNKTQCVAKPNINQSTLGKIEERVTDICATITKTSNTGTGNILVNTAIKAEKSTRRFRMKTYYIRRGWISTQNLFDKVS